MTEPSNTTPEGLAERAEAGHTRRDGESMNDFAWRAVEESGAICKELVIAIRTAEEQRDRMRGALERIADGKRPDGRPMAHPADALIDARQALSLHQEKAK